LHRCRADQQCLVRVREGNPADSIDLKKWVILHYDDKGLPLEIEILDAAKLSMLNEISISPAFGCKQEEVKAS
jgi:hypothetical protein